VHIDGEDIVNRVATGRRATITLAGKAVGEFRLMVAPPSPRR
jgi:hypothetical protein